MPDAPYAWHHEAESEEPVSVHQLFQLFQENKMSEKEFIKSLGGEEHIPPAALKQIKTETNLSFAKFTKACGNVNSFEKMMVAGGRTKYKDSAKSIIADNSGKAQVDTHQNPGVGGGENPTHHRVISDINAEREASIQIGLQRQKLADMGRKQLPIRQRNEVSLNNPMAGEIQAPEQAGEDKQGMLGPAIRMYLNNELTTKEVLEFVKSVTESEEAVQKTQHLITRHHNNGPYGFQQWTRELREIVASCEKKS